MASEIHTIIPQNINLVNETSVYEVLSKNLHTQHLHEFINNEQSRDYSYYNGNGDTYNYLDSSGSVNEAIEVPFSLMPQLNYQTVNYDKTKIRDTTQRRYINEYSRTISPKGYESEESSISYSSRGTSDNNARNKEKTVNDQKDLISPPGLFQPNLYQPNFNFNRNSRYYHGGHRSPGGYLVIERKTHGLMKRFQARVYGLRINPNPRDLINGGPWDQLNKEIWNIFTSKVQKEDTYLNKINLWKSVFLFLRTSLHNCSLYLVGSTMSGFGLEGSDIDLCVLTKPFINDPRIDSVHQLNRLKHLMLKNGLASEAELIMAKVPILKFKNKETGFEVDLNCNNAVGIENTHLLYCYAQLDWRVRPLVVMVKVWAQANHINEARNMTISSYSWALMVIHYLQCGVTPAVLPCLHKMYPEKFSSYDCRSVDIHEDIEDLKNYESDNTTCLGDLLIGFFQYYSYFNYSQFAISVRTGTQLLIETCKQVKSPKNDPNQWKCLCIEEPFDFSNTARSVFDQGIFKHIKQIIMFSYKELARNKTLSHILPVSLKR